MKSKTAMPMYLATIVPTGIIGILIAAMLAAEMSTDSGYLLTWATVIYNDLIIPCLRRPLSAKARLLIERSATVIQRLAVCDNIRFFLLDHFSSAVRVVFEAEYNGTAAVNLELNARIGVHHGAGGRVSDAKVVRSTHQFSVTGTNIISINKQGIDFIMKHFTQHRQG